MTRRLPVLSIATLLATAGIAHAAFTTPVCLAKKRAVWGNLRKCQATEQAKQLQAKTPDLAKCQTKFTDAQGKIGAKATAPGVPCRYGDHGDGTVIDYDTGLQWEKKTATNVAGNLVCRPSDAPHCVLDTYTWEGSQSFVSGMSTDGSTATGGLVGFAGHSDWRLPRVEELRGIVDLSVPGCTSFPYATPCIDPVFGPTLANEYWSATNTVTFPGWWAVIFAGGGLVGGSGSDLIFVRAVRSAL